MIEAELYESIAGGRVRCHACAHRCTIKQGGLGKCRVRQNIDGKLMSLVYGKIVSAHADPIEKKPLFHFLPGSKSLSICTVGCNFKCRHCQNYQIAQFADTSDTGDTSVIGDDGSIEKGTSGFEKGAGGFEKGAGVPGDVGIPGEQVTPKDIVDAAERQGCRSIAYTYTEPTVFIEFARDTARLAKERGIKNVFVSNGFMTPESVEYIAPYLDGNNIDLKGDEEFYKNICGAHLNPVLETIKLMKQAGIWVEVTTLIIPGHNDSDETLRGIAEFVASVDDAMPWHVSKFYPTYLMTDREATPLETLRRAVAIGKRAGLKYIYEGNVPGMGGENTYCFNCKKVLIERNGFNLKENFLNLNKCYNCELVQSGVWL